MSNATQTDNAEAIRQTRLLLENAITSRSQLLHRLMDERRDIDDECGYIAPSNLTLNDLQDMYDKEGIARRVVHVLPEETWKVRPQVVEDEDPDVSTEFEQAFDGLGKDLMDEESYFKHENLNPVWEYLLRADILSRIGYYGCILLGVNDGKELIEPLEPSPNNGLIYLRVFSNQLARINSLVKDPTNRRYSKPEQYTLSFGNPADYITEDNEAAVNTKQVHWSRVIHIPGDIECSETHGVPAMRPVWNRLYDLRKTYGGSAEMYWRGAFPGYSIETQPQGEVAEIDYSEAQEVMEKYMTGLQRYLAISGVNVKSLAPQVVDPSKHIDKQLEAICIEIGIPKRIFMGSERGELASSEDKYTWNDRLKFRQQNKVLPHIVIPFINRLIGVGILPKPKQYTVLWPDYDQMSASDKAAVAAKRTEAMAKYVGGSVYQLMAPMDYLTRELCYSDEEATAIIEAAASEIEEAPESPEAPPEEEE